MPKGKYANLLRFYKFALPYWKLIVLSLAAMMLYSAVGVNAVLLVEPFIETFEQQAQQAPAAAPAEEELQEPLDGFRDRIEDWFVNLPVVRSINEWLFAELSLRRIAAVLALVIGPLFLLSGFLADYLPGRVVWSVLADLRVAVFNRLTDLSLSYYGAQRTGEIISRLTNDISHAQSALKILFSKLVLQPLMLALFLGLALLKSWQLTLVAAGVSPLIILAMRRFGGRIRRHARKTLERLADVTDSVTQMLSGIRVVKSFHMEAAEQEAFRQRNDEQVRRALKLVRSEAWASVVPQLVAVSLAGALALLMADYLHRRGRLDLPDMAICMISLSLVASRLKRIVKAYNDLQQSTASVDRIFELIDTAPRIADSPDAVELEGVREGVQFEDVHFAYDAEPVLKGIDLFVPRGHTYAIVGETGAGKSTMLDLIPRFYDAQRGAVKVDGVDVRHVTRESLMRQIAIVGQRPFLFNRSIAENIRYGKPDATDEEVVAAAEAANIHAFIMSLPRGYETLAGEAGDRFSGGQRQCITIARALLKNAPILILDEATSSLDAQSERQVQRALENLMANRTTFVIAHRLSTVRHADQIVVLRDGRIVEQGKHEELLARGGEYDRLYRLQFSEETAERGASDAG